VRKTLGHPLTLIRRGIAACSARPAAGKVRSRAGRSAAVVAAAGFGLFLSGVGFGTSTTFPNPCALVPSTAVASALGMKSPPTSSLATLSTSATCTYGNAKVSVSVGQTALLNSAPTKTRAPVKGLPHGIYSTFTGSTQTQIVFYTGTSATALYGVVRNYGKIRRAKLERFAKLLYAGMVGSGSSATQPGLKILTSG
jgi:hypothetical protein